MLAPANSVAPAHNEHQMSPLTAGLISKCPMVRCSFSQTMHLLWWHRYMVVEGSGNAQLALERAVRVELGARILNETLELCHARLELFECEFNDELLKMPTSLTKCSSWAQQVADLAHASLDGLADESFWDESNRRALVSLRRLLSAMVVSVNRKLGVVGGRIPDELSEAECEKRMNSAAQRAGRVNKRLCSLRSKAEQCHQQAQERLHVLRGSSD